jgi:ubiquinone biosynthesis protein
MPWILFTNSAMSKERRLRQALERMGPIFIKFGQLLSTRHDILPKKLSEELVLLQDNVTPFSSLEAMNICAKSLGTKFSDFSAIASKPIAAASIAQVYTATLLDVHRVILKIRRPNLLKMLKADISLLKYLAYFGSLFPMAARLRLIEVVNEFESSLLSEANFIKEASNAAQIRKNFSGSNILYIPKIYCEYTTAEVLVMEQIISSPVKDILKNTPLNVDLKTLSQNIFLIFLKQVFEDSFFHGDMHPGNIFIDLSNPFEPQYQFVDFGIVGTLSRNDQRYLAENLLAFFEQDYHKVALLHLQSGWAPPNTQIAQFEFSIRAVCEPIFQRPLKEISVGETFLKLIEVAQEYKIIIQPQLVLLQKTLLAVEGLSRQLYPDLDLWTTAYPYVRRSVRLKFGFAGEVKKLLYKMPILLDRWNEHLEAVYSPTVIKHQHEFLLIKTLIGLSILSNTSLYYLNYYQSIKDYILILSFHCILYQFLIGRIKEQTHG